MKKILAVIMVAGALAQGAFGQGRVGFNNLSASDGVTVLGGALNGQYVGAADLAPGPNNFSASLYWALGVVADPSLLSEHVPARTLFYGTTGGGGPLVDGSGVFDGGSVTLPAPVGQTVTVQIRAWDGTAGYNTVGLGGLTHYGSSALLQVVLVGGTDFDPDMSQIAPFSVVPVPEPSTFALAGLGAAALLIFRRRQ
jgi:hypothetical protein